MQVTVTAPSWQRENKPDFRRKHLQQWEQCKAILDFLVFVRFGDSHDIIATIQAILSGLKSSGLSSSLPCSVAVQPFGVAHLEGKEIVKRRDERMRDQRLQNE